MKLLRISVLTVMALSLVTSVSYGQTAEQHCSKALAYRAQGERDKGMEEFKKAVAADPDFAPAYYGLGGSYSEKGMLDEAIAEYKKALAINPKFAEVYVNLGFAYAKKGKRDEAIAEFKKAVSIDPHNILAHLALGAAYNEKGMLDEAIAEHKKLLVIDSRLTSVHVALAKLYNRNGQHALAIWHHDKGKELRVKMPDTLTQALKPYRVKMSQTNQFNEQIIATLEQRLQENPKLTEELVPRIEKKIVETILATGPGERLVIDEVRAEKDGLACSLTVVKATNGMVKFETDFPTDSINFGASQFGATPSYLGNGSVHRYRGKVNAPVGEITQFVSGDDRANLLTFAVIDGFGYVYVRGKGKLIKQDGQEIVLGD